MACSSGAIGRKRKTCANWSNVPADVLGLTATKISSVADYLAFGAVCRWWRCAADEKKSCLIDLMCQSRWLMKISGINVDARVFYSLTEDKLFNIELPELRGRKCFGSPFGCLVTVKVAMYRDGMHPREINMNLFNPLSKASIPLPNPMHSLDCSGFRVHKAILTANPDSPDCLVLMRHTQGLAFTRPGAPLWSPVKAPNAIWGDIIYFNGNLYGCKSDGPLFQIDLSSAAASAFAPSPRLLDVPFNYSTYLVELGADLCLVIMFLNRVSNYRKFEIYSIDMETREWRRVESLGDWCLVCEAGETFFSVDPVAAQLNKLSPGCVYCPTPCEYVAKIWNVEKRKLLRWDLQRDVYTMMYPSTRITPSLLP